MKWKQGCARFFHHLAGHKSQQDASHLLSSKGSGMVFPIRWTGSLHSQSDCKSSCNSFRNLYTHARHLWGLSQGPDWSSRSISSLSWTWTHICLHIHKSAPTAQLARLLLACPKLSLTVTLFNLYCDNTKLLHLLMTRKMYILYFHRKLFFSESTILWSTSELHPSEIRDLCTSQIEPWGLTFDSCSCLYIMSPAHKACVYNLQWCLVRWHPANVCCLHTSFIKSQGLQLQYV